MDEMNEHLEPLRSFILPGGLRAAAALHQARTVARRAERLAVTANAERGLNPAALVYLHRLSDHLFVLGRAINADAGVDIHWQTGPPRGCGLFSPPRATQPVFRPLQGPEHAGRGQDMHT